MTASRAQIAFAGEPRATFRCALDGGGAASCGSPLTLTDLGLGPHAVAVAQRDEAGNEGSAAIVGWRAVAPASAPLQTARARLVLGPRPRIGDRRLVVGCGVSSGEVTTCSVRLLLAGREVGRGAVTRAKAGGGYVQVTARVTPWGRRALPPRRPPGARDAASHGRRPRRHRRVRAVRRVRLPRRG